MHCRTKVIAIITLAIAAASCGNAFADDSAMSIVNGGTAEPLANHKSIRMVRETVDVKLGTRVGHEWPVFVHCLFVFKNDGPATDANLGFPEKAEASGDAEAMSRLHAFKSWVDGKPVKVKYLPSSKNQKDELFHCYLENYKAWYVKKVHFNAGQTHKVVVVYSARLGRSNTSTSPDGIVFNFGYILRTGANWKGNIEEAVVNVDTSAAGSHYRIKAFPSGYVIKKNKLAWRFKSFEPAKDIGVSFVRKFPKLNGTCWVGRHYILNLHSCHLRDYLHPRYRSLERF